jgi:hypothetical protein
MAERPHGSNPDIDYERRDLTLKPLLLVAVGLIVLLGAAPFIILAGFPSTAHDVDRRLTVVPPAPRLQTHPREDLERYLGRERVLLDTYGWVDRAHGVAHVPVAVAMQRLARQGISGFPSASPSEQPTEAAAP